MFTEAVTVGSVALSIIENRKTILRILKRLRRKILRGTWRVPVFGDGGTGKTTLGQFLSGELTADVAIGGYRESIDKKEFSLKGEIPCILLIPPGQKRRRPSTWQALFRLLSAGKAKGLINVVSWGYHSTELEYNRHEVYRQGIDEPEYINNFLTYNRNGEIRALNELAPHLTAAEGKIWMITLVTKQDLWWPERYNVEKYYKDGEYDKCIQRIISVKGAENFSHNYYSVSLILENLRTKDGNVLASTTSGYDQQIKTANLTNFLKGLNDLIR
jgi:hypothetical protein